MSASDAQIAAIDALLPQTQCEQCGYPGCWPYAKAIANAEAPINQCPPGGQAGIDALAELLDQPSQTLNPAHGAPQPPRVAWIDEAVCIGCTKCIQACPVDAIVGARKLMHTVIQDECTGCDLCLAPCPVDCIEMHPSPKANASAAVRQADRDRARERFGVRNQRLAQRRAEREARRVRRNAQAASPTLPDRRSRQAIAQAALAKARARRQQRHQDGGQ